ncbi:zinc knuckle CX2CX4HX4C containing protein [Tanacetum coccineum]
MSNKVRFLLSDMPLCCGVYGGEATIKDIAKRIKNIDGKLIGKCGKPLVVQRGEPKSDGLGVKIVDENTVRHVPHNPKDKPLKSIIKGHRNVSTKGEVTCVSFVAGINGAKLHVHGDNSTEPAGCSSKDNHVQPVSFADVMGSTTSRKVNISVLVNEAVIPGANIVIPSDAVDKKANNFANTLYGYFIGRRHAFLIVLANGPWRIRLLPIMLNIWNPTKKLIKKEIKKVSVWVKLHDVPVVAYSEVGLSLITTKVGRPIMLDAHTADMCVISWGRCSYARALIEVSAEQPLVESFVVAIPIKGEEGHSLDTITMEYEWKPPQCESCKIFDHLDSEFPRKPKVVHTAQNREDDFVKVHGKKKQPTLSKSRQIEGIRFTKPKSTWIIKTSKPSLSKVNNSNNSRANKYIDDGINLLELKNSFDKLREEDAVFDVVKKVDSGNTNQDELMNVSTNVSSEPETTISKEVAKEVVASSSKPKLSFGHLDLANISDTDDDEVFASNEEYEAYMSSIGGGHPLKEEFDMYDDDYADQICDLPGQIKAFRDFQLLHSGRK